jgi:carboxyl-terminal processing protease
MKPVRRSTWFVISTVVLCALLGGIYGRRVEATTATNTSTGIRASLKKFTRVYGAVEAHYANPVNPNKVIYGPLPNSRLGAIPGMLSTLDPHSTFFDPHAFAQLQQDQEGHYFGVGMQIIGKPGKMGQLETYVLAPIPGSPAFRAGIRPGDMIASVDGKSTSGMSVDQVAHMLLGPKGTVVRITIVRQGWGKPLQFTITRQEISQQSVDAAFLLQPHIAYIHINKFNETTNRELTRDLKNLDEDHLRGLILDLRDNPGGLLQQAVEVSDHFLKKGQLIVYHYGRASKEKRYYAVHGDSGNKYPIVVLVDHMTASAAEIVTGALQDHDRALVMGQTSFGKGLVQTVFPLSDHTGLALTTAHYYTPSGRLIQRPYNDMSLYDYYYYPQREPLKKREIRYTDGGRPVYGGGGITPDVKVPPFKLSPAEQMLADSNAYFAFAQHYLGVHKTVAEDFQPNAGVMQEFYQFLADKKIPVTPQAISSDLGYVKEQIRIQLVGMIYGQNVAEKIDIESDPLVQDAVAHLNQAQALMQNPRKYMASNAASQGGR